MAQQRAASRWPDHQPAVRQDQEWTLQLTFRPSEIQELMTGLQSFFDEHVGLTEPYASIDNSQAEGHMVSVATEELPHLQHRDVGPGGSQLAQLQREIVEGRPVLIKALPGPERSELGVEALLRNLDKDSWLTVLTMQPDPSQRVDKKAPDHVSTQGLPIRLLHARARS